MANHEMHDMHNDIYHRHCNEKRTWVNLTTHRTFV